VRHHSHFHPFALVGPAHQSYNLNAKIKKEFSCFFHNLEYDSRFIIQAMSKLKEAGVYNKYGVIAKSAEKVVSEFSAASIGSKIFIHTPISK